MLKVLRSYKTKYMLQGKATLIGVEWKKRTFFYESEIVIGINNRVYIWKIGL